MVRHGTRSKYTGGCRGDKCRAANSTYVKRRLYAAQTGTRQLPATLRHGTTGAYSNWGCRCDECRAANSAANREKQQWRCQRGRES